MIGMNYTITTSDGAPLPLGTPVVLVVNGAIADVWADPANPGRYQLKFPNPGPVTAMAVAAGCAPKVWNDTIPAGGGEATSNNPLVLPPL
jgi:hypothetical protein